MFNTTVTHTLTIVFLVFIGYMTYDYIGTLYFIISGLGCFLYISYLLASLVDNTLPRFRVSSSNKAVFVTGCDKGFGRLLAIRLDSLGYKVFAGCLEPEGKETQKLKEVVSNNLEIIPLDVTQVDSVQNALETVESKLGCYELWAVVNNAGVIERGEVEWTPLEVYRKHFEVNVFGVVSVTQAFLPLLRKYKGRVVTVTSIAGRLTFSGLVPYSMSKHAARSFCEGLRLEMKKFGVKVITVEPFAHRTGMTEMSTVLKSVQDTWNKFSGKCKNDVYDENYIQAFNESILKFTEATTLPDISRVIDSLVEAVCTVSPHYSYIPGNSEGLLNYWFSKRIPKTYLDYSIRKYITFDCDVEKYLNDKEMNKKNS